MVCRPDYSSAAARFIMTAMRSQHQAAASVIIPAHNEGRVIAECLVPVMRVAESMPLDVIVAANGCTDNTVAVARSVQGVTVVDLPTPSKVAALNAADQLTDALPRIYLDADVRLDEEAIRCLVSTLSTERPLLAAPHMHRDTDGADAVVRAFYRIHAQLPAALTTAVGRGVYGLSGAGRSRFDQFPDVQGDDLFVNRLFSPDETVICNGLSTVRAPRRWRDLIRVRTRLAQGNAELARTNDPDVRGLSDVHDFSTTTRGTLGTLVWLTIRTPRQLPGILIYAVISAIARAPRRSARRWHRDESSR